MISVIMAGGSGTRFWPVSRKHLPKQFLDITGHGPMVLETCNRLGPVSRDDEIILIMGQEHLVHAKELFKDRKVHILAEHVGRNTSPCIGLGAIYARHLFHEGPIAFLPADHFIGDPHAFIEALTDAERLAASGGIVTLGIVPNKPETGYGYIRRDQNQASCPELKAYGVSEFVEKPDLETARQYLASGEYFWNGGIFVATAETILEEMKRLLPTLHKGLIRMEKVLGTENFESEFKSVYENIEAVSFDYGIMERTTERVYVIPCQCGWSDVGSWASLYELKSADYDENRNLSDGKALLVDCERSYVSSHNKRLVVCMGLKNCLVVDTPDTVLVADLERSQDIGQITNQLKNQGKEDLL